MTFIIDTNVLLRYPKILEEKENIAITIRCIEELDQLKKNENPEIAHNARRASNYIFKHKEKIIFINETKKDLSVDNEILFFAKKKGFGIITNDLNMIIKSQAENISCFIYNNNTPSYTGIYYYYVNFNSVGSNTIVDEMLETKNPVMPLKENQFLIIKNEETKEPFATLRYRNNKLEILNNSQPIMNNWTIHKKIFPRNPEQSCLFDLLFDPEIKILLAQGKYGSDKTISLANYALQELQKEKINKIIWVPNNSFNHDSREVGTLPGNLFEKELPFLGSLIDIIGEQSAISMLSAGILEIVPISIMRGRNFYNSIILVNEAQNLTEEHIKLLLGRCAEGTRIFFDGDIKQTDNHLFKEKSGLKLLLNLADSPDFSKIFGFVTLNTIERSFTARASDFLDEIY